MTALADLDDVAAVSRPVPDDAQDQVERLLVFVSASVRSYTRQAFDPVTGDIVTITPIDGEIILPQRPVTHVSSVEVNGVAIAPSAYSCTSSGHLVRVIPPGWQIGDEPWGDGDWPGWDGNGMQDPLGAPVGVWGWPDVPVTITYNHGGATPDEIKLVVAEATAERWIATIANPDMVASRHESLGSYSDADTFRLRGDALSAWSPAHKTILDRFRRPFRSVKVR